MVTKIRKTTFTLTVSALREYKSCKGNIIKPVLLANVIFTDANRIFSFKTL